MQRRRSLALVLGMALATGLFVSGPVSAEDGDGGGGRNARDGETTMREVAAQTGDHSAPKGKGAKLPSSTSNVVVVGREVVTDIPDHVADVAYHKGFAYLARWQAGLPPPRCGGGAWVVDMRDPKNPEKLGFLESARNTYATEGMHAVQINTPQFQGDILVISNEICNLNGTGGLTIWDISDPFNSVKLSEGAGDTTTGHFEDPNATPTAVHTYHSAFVWRQPGKAYVIATDNNESGQYDVDIFDISDPANPVLIEETGRPDWPTLNVDAHGTNAFLHDMVVKSFGGNTRIGALSYWDGGWVNLDLTDPTNPVFLGESDSTPCDPLITDACPPEGNAHYGEWNRLETRFIGNDEDFSPFRLTHEILTGPDAGVYPAGEFGWTVPITTLPDKELNGPTVFGGYGCPGDRDNIPTAAETGITPGTDEELILVTQRGPVSDPNDPGEACFFSEKVETAQLLGYDGAIVANHHSGAGAGASPDAFLCGSQGHVFTPEIPGTCIGHREMHLLFGYPPDYTVPYPLGDPGDLEPDIGDVGETVSFLAEFDGWSGNHLFITNPVGTWDEVGYYAIPESLDEDLAIGGEVYSVHEVATDPMKGNRNLAYFAYYDGGFRVTKYGSGIGFQEVGHFVRPDVDFWGVQLAGTDNKGRRLIAASDRNSGLFIFRYTGG